MKKLMFAAAALAAGFAMADVTSANIVGYLNGNLTQDGRNAKLAAFTSVGDMTSIKLSELSVKGYGEDGLDLGGCWGDISIRMLKKDGSNLKMEDGMPVSYYWYDEEGEYAAGWYDMAENPLKNGESQLGNADEIVFAAGEAFTVFCASDYIGCELVSAGQVFTSKLNYELTTDGRNMLGNPAPTTIKLSDIAVSGYGEDGLDLGGCWGDISIRMLKKDGSNQKMEDGMPVSYYWYDEEGEYAAGWYDMAENPLKNDESELGNADEITFAAGEGFVVFCASDYIGCTVDFPALKLN